MKPTDIPDAAICPECKGEGGWGHVRHAQVCGTIEDAEERDRFCMANCVLEDRVCSVCKGTGRLVGLPRAIYLARGGAAPVQRRGYA